MAATAVQPVQKAGTRFTTFLKPVLMTLSVLAGRAISPHKASLSNLTRMPLTVAGLGSVDVAFFHLGAFWGWLVMGLSLMALEHMIADEV